MARLFPLLAFGATLGALLLLDRPRPAPKQNRWSESWDDYLASRVRRLMPESVQVRVRDASVILHGAVPYSERDRLLATALDVPGVLRVVNLLENP
jgi:hypothetical protein